MNLALYIARRYLFAKKSHNAINIISMISVCSVAVATIALVCVLSAFNGFSDLVASMFNSFDPELKITPAQGKVFDPDTDAIRRVRSLPEIEVCTEVLQDNILLRYNTQQGEPYGARQEIAVAKGVSDEFLQMIAIDSLLIDGRPVLHEGETSYGILGIGLAYSLGIYGNFVYPLEIYVPKRDEKVNLTNPASSFQLEYAYIGGIFRVNQAVYDDNMLILPISLVRSFLNYPTEVSALELTLTSGTKVKAVQKQIKEILGDDFRVADRYEQQQASYKMMQIEKWITFLILIFVLTIALFSVVSSLLMLMIEKKDDVQMLRSMGADDRMIRHIFLFEGAMIPTLGAVIGIVTGLMLCLLQQKFGILKLGDTVGAFMYDTYPIRIQFFDIAMIFLTVSVIGLLAAWYPVYYFGNKWLKKSWKAVMLFPFLWTGCDTAVQEQRVMVTIDPQCYFADKIAGDYFDIQAVVPVGQSPETYDPAPYEMVRIAQSKAYLQIGKIGFEQAWMQTIKENNPEVAFFDLSEGIQWLEGKYAGAVRPRDDEHAEHYRHRTTDPHIWNAAEPAKIIAKNTLDAFVQLDPEHKDMYQRNYTELIHEIRDTERILHEMLDTLTHRTFVIYHPALTYFAHEFNLVQMSIEADGKVPSAASLKELVDKAKDAGVRVVFVQQEFDRKHAEQLAAEIGARVVTVNPLDVRWKEQMVYMAEELVK